jgi:hypothetical protein
MSTKVDERLSELRRLAKQFDDRMKLARASELARDGRLLEAEGVLCQGKGLPQSVDELDLLARIHVRQGRYEDARRRWRDAAKLDGGQSHDGCIEALDGWLEYRHKVVLWRLTLAGWLIAATGATFALIHFGFRPFK